VGATHRISNEHDDDLVVIEIQRGPYLGEDDIVRLEDDYGRHAAQ
jgi:mannose-6-phosphate isomerase-like protein (cupin superfamily)